MINAGGGVFIRVAVGWEFPWRSVYPWESPYGFPYEDPYDRPGGSKIKVVCQKF